MNQAQYEKVASAPGFVAALDQSGGSTPKARYACMVLGKMRIRTMLRCSISFTKCVVESSRAPLSPAIGFSRRFSSK